jgi:DNA-binding CsgD family transcriptional regulator
MNTLELSQSIGRLITALNIEKNQDTHFLNWLAHICEITQAEHAILKCNNSQNNQAETWHCGGLPLDITEHVFSSFTVDDYSCSLTLYFSGKEKHQQVHSTLDILKNHINTCLKLGLAHHHAYRLQQLGLDSLSAFNLGVIEINHLGHVVYHNVFAETLFKSKQLSKNKDGILLLGKHKITPYLKNGLPYRFQWNNEQYHFFCSLNEHKYKSTSWNIAQNTISLTIQPLRYAPDPDWLMALLNLNPSQALVASYACCGLSAKEISKETQFSINTVYSYLKNIYSELNINNQTQLASAIWPNIPT